MNNTTDVTDELRYNAYILCVGTSLDMLKKELQLAKAEKRRAPRNGYCPNDILIKVSEGALCYAITYYDELKNEVVDSWQSFFLSCQERERLSSENKN